MSNDLEPCFFYGEGLVEKKFNRDIRTDQPDDWSDHIAKLLHYPEHWDTMAYPTVYDAIEELASCSECAPKREIGVVTHLHGMNFEPEQPEITFKVPPDSRWGYGNYMITKIEGGE